VAPIRKAHREVVELLLKGGILKYTGEKWVYGGWATLFMDQAEVRRVRMATIRDMIKGGLLLENPEVRSATNAFMTERSWRLTKRSLDYLDPDKETG
jgi:hypothetical protein